MDTPVVLMHGFTRDQAIAVMRAAKQAAAAAGCDPGTIAFATTTPNNIGWTVGQLIEEVSQEHEYMKKYGPEGPPPGAQA